MVQAMSTSGLHVLIVFVFTLNPIGRLETE
jgi:hypothetical protein